MKFYQYVIIGLLFVVMSSAQMGAQIYDTRQSEITREGNHLLTQHKVAFSGTAREARALLDASLGHYSIFRDLDSDGSVRAVDSDRLDLLQLPVYEGRSFRRGEQGVALAGAQVPIRDERGTSFYDFDGVSYEVIGRLGRESRSLVANDVIISDRALVESADPQVGIIVDGPAMEEQAAMLPTDKVKRSDTSVNRRASVDLVSPIVDVVVSILVNVSAVFTGILASQLTRRRFRVGWLVGRSPLRMFTAALMAVLMTAALGTCLSLVAGLQMFTELQGGFGLTAIGPAVVAVVTFMGALSIEFTRMRKWR